MMPRKVSQTEVPRSRKSSGLEPEKSRKISIFEPTVDCTRLRKNSASSGFNGSSESLKGSRRLSINPRRKDDPASLIHTIDEALINRNATFSGPYGRRKVCYCDYAESGRSLQFIEDFIVREVLQFAGDGRLASSITSIQSALFRQESEDIVRKSVHATDKDDVIFVNRGRSSMVELIQRLGLLEIGLDSPEVPLRPVLFVATCQSAKSLNSWQKIGAKIVRVNETREGILDLDDLENQLLIHENGWGPLIGLFSAADPATGQLADDVATTLILHQHGAIACWDYTQAAPYVPLDMNPSVLEASAVYKDVMLFSVNKFLGGAQTPDVLVIKKSLVKRPSLTPNEDYDDSGDSFSNVVNCARAGLVLQIHNSVGTPLRSARQEKITRTILTHLKNIPEIILVGGHSLTSRLPSFTFLVRHPRGTYLHHNFISAVLNDVFGIQTRTLSADDHLQKLLGIDDNLNSRLTTALQKPGATRISLPYSTSDNELAFVLEALKMAATEAWKLLPQYKMDEGTGEWRHYSQATLRDRKLLGAARLMEGRICINERKISSQNVCPVDHSDCLHVARCMFNKARKMAQKKQLQIDNTSTTQDNDRWFMVSDEAEALLLGKVNLVKQTVPFVPNCNRNFHGDCSKNNDNESVCQSPKTPANNFSHNVSPCPVSPSSLHHSLNQIFNPPSKVQFVLGPTLNESPRQRCNSLGSVILNRSNARIAYSHSLPDGDGPFSDSKSHTEELQAYVSEVTRELATEIKSELRDVISKAEQSDTSRGTRIERTDSMTAASASDIAEYLMGVSREMAKEVKTEIRELVSSVVTADGPEKSPPMAKKPLEKTRPQLCSNVVCESRDSGINLSWSPDYLLEAVMRSNSMDSSADDVLQVQQRKPPIRKWTEASSESSNDEAVPNFRWTCPPKAVWRATLEAVDGLQMIQAGDVVLVDLEGPHGLALLHTFHQLQMHFMARGINFSLSAALASTNQHADDVLECLGVPAVHLSVGKDCPCTRRKDLIEAASSSGCNVLAQSDCLDDFAESFLVSVLHGGRLKAMKAQTRTSNQGVRVIRPFVYVRAKSLRDFAEARCFVSTKEKFPTFSCSNCPAPRLKERERCRELLLQQEALFPHLFTSLRSALHPLIGTKYSSERIPLPDRYATDSDDHSIVNDL